MTHVRFGCGPTEIMNRWFALAPTHHCALSVGSNVEQFRKVACLMDIPFVAVGPELSR
jgi:L-arabinose isomerase